MQRGTSTFGHNCMLMHETLIACPRDATRRPNGLCHHQKVSPCNVPRPNAPGKRSSTLQSNNLTIHTSPHPLPSTVFNVRSFIFTFWSSLFALHPQLVAGLRSRNQSTPPRYAIHQNLQQTQYIYSIYII